MIPLVPFSDAATLLNLSPHGLRKLIARSRRAAQGERVKGRTICFCQDGKYGAVRFRPEWLQEYIERTTVHPLAGDNRGNEKPRAERGKTGLDWSDLN